MKDIDFEPEIFPGLWLQDFPNAEVIRLKNAGHYVQEDAYEKVIPRLLKFLSHQS